MRTHLWSVHCCLRSAIAISVNMAFGRCKNLDKIHLCALHLWPMGPEHLEHLYRLMADAIIACIPSDIELRDLYLKWINLCDEDLIALDVNFRGRELPNGRFDLYVPLKQAYIRWDHVQNTLGAPGFQSGLYAFTCSERLKGELDCLIAQIDQYITLNTEW